jgi:hypothetical protein
MSTLILCQTCRGSKQVAPLGGIYKNCTNCQGVGFVTQPIQIIELQPAIITSIQPDVIKEPESEPIITELKIEGATDAIADTLRDAISNNKQKNRYK